jgi:hypothetical protein
LPLRHESTDRSHAADRIDPKLANEPMENADRADPIEPTDCTDPTDPMDRIEPREPIDRIESCDRNDNSEPLAMAHYRADTGQRHAVRRLRAFWPPVQSSRPSEARRLR